MNEKQFADYVFDVVQRVIGKDRRFAIAKAYWEPETQSPRYAILVSRETEKCSIPTRYISRKVRTQIITSIWQVVQPQQQRSP